MSASFEVVKNLFGSVVDLRVSSENEVFHGEFRVFTDNGCCYFEYTGIAEYMESMKMALRFFADNISLD